MAKTTTELGDDGRPVTYKSTRQRRKSEQFVPWTKGPTTRWEKFKRAAVG